MKMNWATSFLASPTGVFSVSHLLSAGLSQSNARKYNRQCKLANQRKVLVTMR